MANFNQKASGAGRSVPTSLSILDDIKKLVTDERNKDKLDQDEFFSNLKRWWCHHYKRPYKDPLLDGYTLEELYYEYCDVNYSKEQEEVDTQANTSIPQEEWDWAAEEEAKEAREAAELEYPKVENDTMVDGAELSNDSWADKYDDKIKVNPSAAEADEGGNISANFE